MAFGLSVMIVGAGAREHAISEVYEKSPAVQRIIVAPGNDFIKYRREKEVITDKECSLKDPYSILALAKRYKPDLVDVAQDDALSHGTVDILKSEGFDVFGPTSDAARIEWDKRWSREFMQKYDIPRPDFRYFDDESLAEEYVNELYDKDPERLLYIKTTGLCAGKGALKTTSLEEAIENIRRMKDFPEGAGDIFLVEEGLFGEEFSYFAISDGKSYKTTRSAQDNKTVFNFDEGEQTGGMGAVSPALVTKGYPEKIEKEMIQKAIDGMADDGAAYTGILFLGGIIFNGEAKNIEYNARWGDPESLVVLPSFKTDYLQIVQSCLGQRLNEIELEQDEKTRVCVVGASRGYPGDYSYTKGKRIYGIEDVIGMEGIKIFGAGIDVKEGRFYANGGRLFGIVGEGSDILEARKRAYSAMARINIEGNNLHYRTDIGWRDVERILKGME